MTTKIIQELDSFDRELILCKALFSGTDRMVGTTIISKIPEEYFENIVTNKVFKATKAYFEKYDKFPEVDLIKRFIYGKVDDNNKSTFDEIEQLSLDSKTKPDFFMDLADWHLKQTALRVAILESVDILDEKNADDYNRIEDIIRQALSRNILSDIGTYYKNDIDERIIKIKQEDNAKVALGFPDIDKFLNGGLLNPCLAVFMSKTHIGKTNILLNVAFRAMMAGKKVCYVSLEMPEFLLGKRCDSYLTGFNINKLYDNFNVKDTINILKSQIKGNAEIGDILLKEFPPGSLSPLELRSYLTEAKLNGFDFDMILIDYINLMKYDARLGMYLGLKDVTEKCRALSYYFEAPVLSASQLNRSAYFKPFAELDLADCGESMAIPQTADVAWILGQDPMDVVYFNEIQMKTLKNRISGKVGEILKLYNNPGSLKLYDASEMDAWIQSHGLAEVDLKYINDDIQSQDKQPLSKPEEVSQVDDKKSEAMTSFIDDLRG